MSRLWWLVALTWILPFGLVLISGAPYLPTKKKKLAVFMKQLRVKKGQLLIDLGSGDGSVMAYVWRKFGLKSIGYELNPLLVFISRLRLRVSHVDSKVLFGDFWNKPIPDNVDYVYIFLLPRLMEKMKDKIQAEISADVILISYSFKLDSQKPIVSSGGFHAYRLSPSLKK